MMNILFIGGTGFVGKSFINYIKTNNILDVSQITIVGRSADSFLADNPEFKQLENIKYISADILNDMTQLEGHNFSHVVHAAATKIVPTAEQDPFECIKTNVNGAMNLIEACIDQGVKRVVALSTDKASSPINLYGASKLSSDKLFVASNNSYAQGHKTIFSIVRYGNVMGSRGSVIPFFMSIKDKSSLPITDKNMTRFMISLDQGVKLVWHALKDMMGGEIYVKKIPSMKIIDVAKTISPKAKLKFTGVRPGEKIHEEMISSSDSFSTFEYPDYYKILPQINEWWRDKKRIKNGKKVPKGFTYNSLENKNWMTKKQLQKWMEINKNLIGKF